MAASADELITKLRDIVECPICLEQFKDPRLLPCQHSFCTKCLEDVLGAGWTIRCPCCTKEFPVPNGVRDLPVDFRANTQLEIMSGYQKAKVAGVTGPVAVVAKTTVAAETAAPAAQNAPQPVSGYQPCPVCGQIPTVSKKLSCGHRLCGSCVEFLLPVGGDTLHCPTCSEQTTIIPTLNTYLSTSALRNQLENEPPFILSSCLPTTTSLNTHAGGVRSQFHGMSPTLPLSRNAAAMSLSMMSPTLPPQQHGMSPTLPLNSNAAGLGSHVHGVSPTLPPQLHGVSPTLPPQQHGTSPTLPPQLHEMSPTLPPQLHEMSPTLPPWGDFPFQQPTLRSALHGSLLGGNRTSGQPPNMLWWQVLLQQQIQLQEQILRQNRPLDRDTAQGQTEDNNSHDGAKTLLEQQPPVATGVKRAWKQTEEGKYAVCPSCGQLSSDYVVCEGCDKLLPNEPRYYMPGHAKVARVDKSGKPQQTVVMAHAANNTAPPAVVDKKKFYGEEGNTEAGTSGQYPTILQQQILLQQQIHRSNRPLDRDTAQGKTEDNNSHDGAKTPLEQQPSLTTGVKRAWKPTEEGKYAVCPSCGQLSSDYVVCEGCGDLLPDEPCYYTPQAKIARIDKSGIPQQMAHTGNNSARPSIVIVDKKKFYGEEGNTEAVQNPLLYHQLPTAKDLSTRKAARHGATGRGQYQGHKALPEPEIVTIWSSDDEDEELSLFEIAPDGTVVQAATPSTPATCPATASPAPPPQGTPNATVSSRQHKMEDASGQVAAPTMCIPHDKQPFVTVQLEARSIRIGTLKGTPYDQVIMSPLGIDIKMEYEEEKLELRIGYDEMMRVVAHFGVNVPVLFVHTSPQCAARIRNLCNMTTPPGPYFHPISKDEPHRRITIVMNTITQQQIQAVREVCRLMQERPGAAAPQMLKEVEEDQANIMLVKSTGLFGDSLPLAISGLVADLDSDDWEDKDKPYFFKTD